MALPHRVFCHERRGASSRALVRKCHRLDGEGRDQTREVKASALRNSDTSRTRREDG